MSDKKSSNLVALRKKIQQFSFFTTDKIGNGYSCCVYNGQNDTNNEPVAIKVIDMNKLKIVNKKLLISEISILRSIGNHPNLLNIHQIYTTKNNTYIISELCSTDLQNVIRKNQKFTQIEALRYMKQILEGYKAIYEMGIVHRDLKPANILVTSNGGLKIADFGFAIKAQELVSPCGYNVGSPLYMAPESLKNSQYSFKSDIWSLGVILYELLTGETPWRSKNQKQLEWKINNQSIQKKLIGKNFNSSIKQFLIRTLSHNKQERITPREIIKYTFSDIQHNIEIPKTALYIYPNLPKTYAFSSKLPSQEDLSPLFKPKIQNLKTQQIIEQKTIQQKQPIKPNYSQNCQKNHAQFKSLNHYSSNLKSTSKILVTQIHFCRFLYKMISKLKSIKNLSLLNEIKIVLKTYVSIIRQKITNVVYFKFNNFLNIEQHSEYIQTKTFQSIQKIAEDYLMSYESDLHDYWNQNLQNINSPNVYESDSTINLIQVFLHKLQVEIPNEQCFDEQLFKNQIVILDYLMTCKQLIELAKSNNFQRFSRKSKIESIVEGKIAPINYELFIMIVKKAHKILRSKTEVETNDIAVSDELIKTNI